VLFRSRPVEHVTVSVELPPRALHFCLDVLRATSAVRSSIPFVLAVSVLRGWSSLLHALHERARRFREWLLASFI
jgi:hypothetical protein